MQWAAWSSSRPSATLSSAANRRDLRDDVDAVAILVDHTLDPAHLPLDPGQAVLELVLGGAVAVLGAPGVDTHGVCYRSAAMEATTHDHHHHELPTSGSALSAVALSATAPPPHRLPIGEVAGMALGTALGFSNLATIVLAVALAFLFGYTLTSLPLLRAGMALSAVVPVALASDTLSIATMEIVDNAVMVVIPGMHAGLDDVLFWGALSFALVVAGLFAFPVNRWLLARARATPPCTRPASTAARRFASWAPWRPRRRSSGPPCCSRRPCRARRRPATAAGMPPRPPPFAGWPRTPAA